jgi:oxidoreductase family protein
LIYPARLQREQLRTDLPQPNCNFSGLVELGAQVRLECQSSAGAFRSRYVTILISPLSHRILRVKAGRIPGTRMSAGRFGVHGRRVEPGISAGQSSSRGVRRQERPLRAPFDQLKEYRHEHHPRSFWVPSGRHFMSPDPYMRGRMNDATSHLTPQPLNAVMQGGTIGEVVESTHAGYQNGDKVVGFGGRQQYSIVDGAAPDVLRKVDTTHIPLSAYLAWSAYRA